MFVKCIVEKVIYEEEICVFVVSDEELVEMEFEGDDDVVDT